MNTKAIRSSGFEEERLEKRLDGTILQQTRTSQTTCAMLCGRQELCRSFNFCGDRTCQLMIDDVYSTEQGENMLKTDVNCKYTGMKKEGYPVCREKTKIVAITNDDQPGACKINRKRVDRTFSPWNENSVEVDNAFEFKESKTREIVLDSAHGGKLGENYVVVMWVKWVKEPLDWQTAKDNCTSLGGQLFFNFDGTKQQLEILSSRIDTFAWVGGYFKEKEQVWETVAGSVLEKTLLEPLWEDGEPNRKNGKQFHMAIGDGLLFDEDESLPYESVCDMLA